MVLPTSPIWQLGAGEPRSQSCAGDNRRLISGAILLYGVGTGFCRLVQNTPKTGHAKEACSVTWRLGLPKSAREKRTILVRRKSHRH